MFDKFGEFDSAEEINKAASAQWDEGDDEAIKEIAKENGIDPEDVQDFLDGVIDELCTVSTAAIGKLEVEAEAIKLKGTCSDWVEELQIMAAENQDFAAAVRRKGKNLNEFMARCLDDGWNHSWDVPKTVMSKTKDLQKIMNGHMCKVGLPDKRTRKKIAEKYYLGEKA